MTALVVPLAPLYVAPGVWPKACVAREPWDCNGEHCDCPLSPLAQWATLDVLPDVECSTCGGAGWKPTPGDDSTAFRCPDCINGRRPLRAGDRVEIVAGELPKYSETFGDWTVGWHQRGEGPQLPVLVHVQSRMQLVIPLPAPGTVVGSATVEWVGPIYDDTLYDDGLPEDWQPHIFISDSGKVWFCELDPVYTEWRNTPITGHDHLDWAQAVTCPACEGRGDLDLSLHSTCPNCNGAGTVNRWAVKLREAEAT